MKNLLVVPLLSALLAVSLARNADAGYCGACCYSRCAPCCGVNYCGAKQQCCTVMKTCKEVVYEQQCYTCYKTCYETVCEPKTIDCVKYVSETAYRNCEYTVCKPVWETKTRTCSYTVCEPVYETKTRDTTPSTGLGNQDSRNLLHGLQAGLRRRDATIRCAGLRNETRDICYTVCKPSERRLARSAYAV
jgi:hypothetical protein